MTPLTQNAAANLASIEPLSHGADDAAVRVLHVTPFFAPAWVYGGLPESAYQFARHLARAGVTVRVLTTDANGWGQRLDAASMAAYAHRDGIEVRYCARVARQSVSLELLGALAEQVRWADVVHLHAAYSFPTIPTLLAARMLKRPVIWTPHGALQRWSGSRRVGFKSLWEKVCVAVASRELVLHLTSDNEVAETRSRFPRANINLIPNGVEFPQTLHREPRGTQLKLGFVGRLDPKKGIENLLAACRIVKERSGPDFALAIAGSGSSEYEAQLRREIDRLELGNEVAMLGDVRGEEKRRMFERTDVVVVPSFTENFAIVVAEALAHGAAVIASKGTPWKEVERVGCGLWVGNDPVSLADAIVKMSSMPIAEMGERGRRWMAADFSWEKCASEMIALYRNILTQSSDRRLATALSSHS
ncbi:MAG: glycosyltransferase [Candidatus Binatus sp.]|uniref:glycosyltransferase n=1 Tax=Candidatus Binatus sp. TaxID=2811406 RepID=UPI003BEAACD4